MQENEIMVKKLDNLYVGSDCIQLMIPSLKNITIFDSHEIIYHHNEYTDFQINKYLEDDRRFSFPYSSIPMHNRFIFPNMFKFVNQLFNYNDSYFVFGDGFGNGIQYCALKDGSDAILIKSFIKDGERREYYKDYDELESLFTSCDDEIVYNMIINGRIINDKVIPSKKIISDILKAELRMDEVYETGYYSIFDNYDLENIVLNDSLFESPLINVKIKDNKIVIKKYFIYCININKYRVVEVDVPIIKYDLNDIKKMNFNINNTSKVRISRLLNPDIPYEKIVSEKNKVKKR